MKKNTHISTIQMPLLIGAQDLNSQTKELQLLHSLDYEISMNIINDLAFKKFLKNKHQNLPFLCKYNFISQKHVEISNYEIPNLLDFDDFSDAGKQSFPIHKKITSHPNASTPYLFSFQTTITAQQDTKEINITINQQNITFQLSRITSNLKFVRNDYLIGLLDSGSQEKKGLLTMDQSRRFLFLKENMQFPVVGFWLKTQKCLQNVEIFHQLSQFLSKKYERKCLFKQQLNEKRYFYFARLNQKAKKIEAYAVSWVQNQELSRQFKVSNSVKRIQLRFNSQNFITQDQSMNSRVASKKSHTTSRESSKRSSSQNSQQNGMNFTLRESKQKEFSTLESLVNYSYLSPIKQLQDNQKSQDNFSERCQNSPQFSTLTKQTDPQNECVELRAIIEQQSIEIKKLRQIISQMESELKIYKNSRMSTNCQSSTKINKFSLQLSSPNTNQYSLSSPQNASQLTPQDVRRLRESDLRSNSISRSERFKNTSSKKKMSEISQSESIINIPILISKEPNTEKSKELPKIIEQEARDPWEYMEIIED